MLSAWATAVAKKEIALIQLLVYETHRAAITKCVSVGIPRWGSHVSFGRRQWGKRRF